MDTILSLGEYRHIYTVRLTDGMTSAYVSREKYISYSKVI